MKKTGWTFALCIAFTTVAPVAAQPTTDPVTVTLAPVSDSSTTSDEHFFHPATLTVNNSTEHTIRAVRLTPVGGGPGIFWPCVMPPHARQSVTLPLPAFSTAQAYAVNLLPEDSPRATPVAIASATIDWPVELVRREFLQADYDPARWPADTKRNTVTLLALGLLALAATRLIRPPAWRTGSAFAVAAVVTVVVVVYLHTLPDVHEQWLPADRIHGTGEEILAVSALRSTQWSSDRPLVPAYQTMAELRSDESILTPGRAITLPLRAGQTRLFTTSTPSE